MSIIYGTSDNDTVHVRASAESDIIETFGGADVVYFDVDLDGADQINTTDGEITLPFYQQNMFTYLGTSITSGVAGLHEDRMLTAVTLLNANLPNLRDVNIELSSPSDQRQVLLNFHNTGFHFRGNYVINDDGMDVNYPIYNDDDNYYMNEVLSSDKPTKPFDRDTANQPLLSNYTGDMNGEWKLHLVAQYYNDETISTEEGADTIDGFSLTFEGDSTAFDQIILSAHYGAPQIRLTFDQTRVGNGKAKDSTIGSDGGLAVRIQAEDENGELTGAVGRADDETVAYSTQGGIPIEIRDSVTGLSYGDQFGFVVLGHHGDNGNYSFSGIQYSGNMYIHGGLGSDFISGDLGNDVIVGGTGADNLFASVGKDTFVYTSIKDSLRNASDYIFDFDVNEDVIDLRALGALEFSSEGAAQRGVWIAPNDSEGYAGSAVFFDTTGDGQADGKISLHPNTPTLMASNFVLTAPLPEPNVNVGQIQIFGNLQVYEDAATQVGGTFSVRLEAIDGNASDRVSYQLADSLDGLFQLDADTGVLTATRPFDRETMPAAYSLTTTATSTDGSLTSRTFDVQIHDVDEFPLSEITDRNVTANAIHTGMQVGDQVGINVTISDADASGVYYVLRDDAAGRFRIDQQTGVISIAKPVDFSGVQSYNIQVRAGSYSGEKYTNYTIDLFQLIDTSSFFGDFTSHVTNDLIRATRDAEVINYNLKEHGADHIHTIDQPTGAALLDTINLSSTDASQIRLMLNLDQIGNGSAFDPTDAPNQELFGLAVRIRAEDANGDLVGAEGRADDENVQYVAATGTTLDISDHQTGVSIGDQFGRAMFGSINSEILDGSVQADYLHGGMGNDVLLGGIGADVLMGGAGHDQLKGSTGADRMIGGDGNDLYFVTTRGDVTLEQADAGMDSVFSSINWDLAEHIETLKLQGTADIYGKGNAANNVIVGNGGANLIDGGLGVNKLTGGLDNDSYVLRRDYALNTVQESADPSGGVDQVQFGLGVNSSQVWFSQVNNDLQASIIGTGAKVLVKDWYSSGMSVESFKLSNGQQLAAADVQNLVNAMASLTPPAMGQTTLSSQQKSALNSVISSNWMSGGIA